ncbi:MAG: presenilin family intramembrane aspartyl protease [Candidatus Bathyarchaeia archaeon]|jgi:presenilin-like A22 family membrane protease
MAENQQTVEQQKSKELDRFKFEVVYLLPVLASILFGLGCAYLLLPQPQSSAPPVTPISGNSPSAPVGNAIYFVVLVAISATVFYLLLKRRSKNIIKGLIYVAMTAASLLLSLFYINALLAYVPSLNSLFVLVPLSLVVTVLFDVAVFRLGSLARNVAVVGIGGALGIFFGFAIPLWSAVLILAFLAVYDVFAVYRGPVGKIAESSGGLDQLQGLSYSFKDIQMGLGDLVFYSMLTGSMFFYFIHSYVPFGVLPCLVSVVGIMAGSVITLFMLERKGIFPGLPFPIMLGLAGGLITGLVILPLL